MSVGNLGYYSLIFCFLFSISSLYFSYKETKFGKSKISTRIFISSLFQLITIFFAFFCLIYSFLVSDFSIITVYENSNANTPLFYKISGTWGNHEGSLLLWMIVLILFSFLFLITSNKEPIKYRLHTIIFQNIIIIGFLFFSFFISNPFKELIPIPKQGLGLNPILQDPALALHPPILYFGYVGSAIYFSSSLSAMVNKYVSSEWAKFIKKWVFVSWVFLTIGILLGSIWAYYELGWGGFWFWDPVENSSLMPWIASTALLHSIIILEKRGIFKSWTVILSIVTFTLSTTGTFLVRSGILNSVHTFANDPSRGIYILFFLILLSIISLIIFYLYQPIETEKKNFSFLSKETFLLINNWFLMFFLVTILIGTLYPIFLEVITNKKISVGPPFYNFILIPFIIPFLIFMLIGPKLNWIRSNLYNIKKGDFFLLLLTFLFTIIIFYLLKDFHFMSMLIIFTSLILIFSIIKDFVILIYKKDSERKIAKLSKSISHFGFAILILSIGLNSHLTIQKNINLKVGESTTFKNYKLTFAHLVKKNEKNYTSIVGNFLLDFKNHDKKSIKLNPEIRIYDQPKIMTSEASINTSFFSDYYLTMSYISNDEYFGIRFQHKPFMVWIWCSFILISMGGIFGIFTKK